MTLWKSGRLLEGCDKQRQCKGIDCPKGCVGKECMTVAKGFGKSRLMGPEHFYTREQLLAVAKEEHGGIVGCSFASVDGIYITESGAEFRVMTDEEDKRFHAVVRHDDESSETLPVGVATVLFNSSGVRRFGLFADVDAGGVKIPRLVRLSDPLVEK